MVSVSDVDSPSHEKTESKDPLKYMESMKAENFTQISNQIVKNSKDPNFFDSAKKGDQSSMSNKPKSSVNIISKNGYLFKKIIGDNCNKKIK